MSIIELAEKDLKKATLSLERAKVKPNVTKEELDNLTTQVLLRRQIYKIIKKEAICP